MTQDLVHGCVVPVEKPEVLLPEAKVCCYHWRLYTTCQRLGASWFAPMAAVWTSKVPGSGGLSDRRRLTACALLCM